MNGLFPLFLLFLFWMLRAAASRGKTQKSGGQPQRENRGKATEPRQGKMPAGVGPALPQGEAGMKARYRKEFPHLAEDATPAGVGDASSPVWRGGSLEAASLEGTDPCHDDPAAMPVGSLRWESQEGEDPGHDHGGILAAAEGNQPGETMDTEHGGLRLDWTGNEIVRGFIYGEILKRKAG